MNVIVDANVFKGYYLEKVVEIDHGLTDSPTYVFESDNYTLYFDNSDHIMHEYKSLIGSNEASELIIELMNKGKLRLSEKKIDRELEKLIKSKGFDLNSKDKWYIRTALKSKDGNPDKSIHIITEDIDFYNPKKKNCDSVERQAIIRDCKSPVAKELIKRKKVKPICVTCHSGSSY